MPRRALFFVSVMALIVVSACLREKPPAEPYPPGQQTGQGYGGAGYYPPPSPYPSAPPPTASVPAQPPPTPTSTTPPPSDPPPAPGPNAAPGFPCASDNDLQCPFARCIAGRCGGCQSAADCKSGATCAQSPLGMACMPGAGSSSPPPQTPPTTTPPPTTPPSTDAFAAARARCIQRINEYRAKGNAPAVAQRMDKQACADSQAQSDAASNTAHGAFGKCGETAQNECPGWKGSVDTVLDGCLQAMFAEGPGTGPAHGHYNNMMDPSYKGAACGFHQAPDGGIWIVHDFYR